MAVRIKSGESSYIPPRTAPTGIVEPVEKIHLAYRPRQSASDEEPPKYHYSQPTKIDVYA